MSGAWLQADGVAYLPGCTGVATDTVASEASEAGGPEGWWDLAQGAERLGCRLRLALGTWRLAVGVMSLETRGQLAFRVTNASAPTRQHKSPEHTVSRPSTVAHASLPPRPEGAWLPAPIAVNCLCELATT